MSDKFRSHVDRVAGTAAKWFGIYVRVIFGLAAIGAGVAVIQAVFFPDPEPRNLPEARSVQERKTERLLPAPQHGPVR